MHRLTQTYAKEVSKFRFNRDFSYEEDPLLFNFDYKRDLMVRATDRPRVYTLNQFVKVQEEEEELDKSKKSISQKRMSRHE